MTKIRVGVFDSHEVFRRGVVACLAEHPEMQMCELGPDLAHSDGLDVVVMSSDRSGVDLGGCPLVVCYSTEADRRRFDRRSDVFAMLARRTVTAEQLALAVQAAAAGMRINSEVPASPSALNERSRDVLRMLARGAGTKEISGALGYSERTIKSVISEVQTTLGTRNRAHAVAEAVRANLI